jgi:hypothetical protein
VAEIAAGAGAILDHDLPAQIVAELLRQDAGEHIGRAPGRERRDKADGFDRIRVLRHHRSGREAKR